MHSNLWKIPQTFSSVAINLIPDLLRTSKNSKYILDIYFIITLNYAVIVS